MRRQFTAVPFPRTPSAVQMRRRTVSPIIGMRGIFLIAFFLSMAVLVEASRETPPQPSDAGRTQRRRTSGTGVKGCHPSARGLVKLGSLPARRMAGAAKCHRHFAKNKVGAAWEAWYTLVCPVCSSGKDVRDLPDRRGAVALLRSLFSPITHPIQGGVCERVDVPS